MNIKRFLLAVCVVFLSIGSVSKADAIWEDDMQDATPWDAACPDSIGVIGTGIQMNSWWGEENRGNLWMNRETDVTITSGIYAATFSATNHRGKDDGEWRQHAFQLGYYVEDWSHNVDDGEFGYFRVLEQVIVPVEKNGFQDFEVSFIADADADGKTLAVGTWGNNQWCNYTVGNITVSDAAWFVTSQPESLVLDAGETAEFSFNIDHDPGVSLEYQWYWSADGEIDTEIDAPIGQDANSVTIENAQVDPDEGYYYCEVFVDDGDGNTGYLYSDMATLGIRRKVAYWTLDWADFQDGQYLDSSGHERHAVPHVVPEATSFVDGVDPAKTNEGLDLTVEPLAAATAGTQSPVQFTDEMTLSVWVKWAGANGEHQGIISKRDYYGGSQVADWWWQINPDGDLMNANSWAGESLETTPPVEDEWTHLVITVTPNGANLYRNGLLDADQPAFELDNTVSQLVLGGLRVDSAGQIVSAFNGVMDDIRIYNYAKDPVAVADMYYTVSETPVCLYPYEVDPRLDVTGDCQVGLADFAVFATTWLNSGLYPVE